jgi:hypothetical protein
MRIVGLVLAGALAASYETPGHADPFGSRMEPHRPALGVIQVWDGNGAGWHHPPAGAPGAWQTPPGHNWSGGWAAPNGGLHHHFGGWGPYGGPGVPTYWVYVPGSAVFDYPFSDWRGPTGGWGNP